MLINVVNLWASQSASGLWDDQWWKPHAAAGAAQPRSDLVP